jgi:urease accessory protein
MGTNTEATTAPPLLRLLQLSSSLLPIGGFAYSQGLEQAVELGWVNDAPSLVEWLGGIGEHALARLDLPVLRRAYGAWERGDSAQALALSALLLANREAAELVSQDEHLGNALCGVLQNLGIPQAAALYGQSPVSYAVAYALGAAHFELRLEVAVLGYCFAWLEQQVGAAARLVPLGHMASQRVLSELLTRVPRWVELSATTADDEIGGLTPALAMAAAWHESQYSRLFRS